MHSSHMGFAGLFWYRNTARSKQICFPCAPCSHDVVPPPQSPSTFTLSSALTERPHAVLTSVEGLFSLTIIMETSRRFLKKPKGGYHIIDLGAGHPKEMGAETKGMQVCCKISTPWLRSSSDICRRVECVLWCWYVIECHSPIKNKFLFEMKSLKFTLMTGVFVWWHLCHQFWVFKSTPLLQVRGHVLATLGNLGQRWRAIQRLSIPKLSHLSICAFKIFT